LNVFSEHFLTRETTQWIIPYIIVYYIKVIRQFWMFFRTFADEGDNPVNNTLHNILLYKSNKQFWCFTEHLLTRETTRWIIPYIIFYYIKVIRQFGCFTEHLLTRETTRWIIPYIIFYYIKVIRQFGCFTEHLLIVPNVARVHSWLLFLLSQMFIYFFHFSFGYCIVCPSI